MTRLRIGISTCPNDTFAFSALLSGAVTVDGVEIEFVLSDVEDLNLRMRALEFDIAKVSFAAVLDQGERLTILPVGAAIGFGVGPVLLSVRKGALPGRFEGKPRVLAPGAHTTAALLWRAFYGSVAEPRQVVFSQIMPMLLRGEADFGVCIHEGRFTYQQCGLHLAEDFGRTWEARTRTPLPLGGLVARRSLDRELLVRVVCAIRASIDHAREHRAEALKTMRTHAREFDDAALWQHVDLYVNAMTRDLGAEGQEALLAFAALADARADHPAFPSVLDV